MQKRKIAAPPFSRDEGFTLLELIVVLAMIGLLVAIAIPIYQKMGARARQAEAKIALGFLYAMEISFAFENGSFTQCIAQAGYAPVGSVRYYSIGSMAPPTDDCGPDGNGSCGAYAWNPLSMCDNSCATLSSLGINDTTTGATAKASAGAVIVNTCTNQGVAGTPMAWTVHQNQFLLGAVGNVSPSPAYDQWQIDQNKNLVNIQSGI